jgi:RibD C-terminal domain
MKGELHGEVDLHDERVTRWLHRRPAWRPFDPDWVRKLKANVASDIAVAGPELAAQVIQAGLVDEFQMRVCPVVIGGGKRYFPSGMRPLHTFRFLRPARLRTPLLGYSAPHLSARGTLTLLNNALLSAHFRIADYSSRMDGGSPVLELRFGDQLQEPKKCRSFFRSQLMPDILIGGHPVLDQPFPVLVSFGRQPDVNCSARFCLSLRHESFLSHRLDGPMHDSSIETKKRGDLILIERSAASEC